jgi:ABC-type branched-subunit amino acid transport system substrate-binding protein
MIPIRLLPFLLFAVYILFVPRADAQDRRIVQSERAEAIFQAGIAAFSKGDYGAALENFDRILDGGDITQRTTAAYIMSGKAMIELGQHREAIRRLQRFIDRFPYSLYQDDAYYTIGVAYLRDRRYEDALYMFLRTAEYTERSALLGDAYAYASRIISEHLPPEEVNAIYEKERGDFARGYLALEIARQFIERGNIGNARNLLEDAIRDHWRHPLIGEMRSLLDTIDKGISLKIGVILPLFEEQRNNPARSLGIELLQGIRFAVDEHNAQSEIKLYMDIRDSRRQPSIAARHAQELVSDGEVVAILGPVFSDEAFATAGIANARGVPIITPTATANHIADIGRYVFQTNPDYRTRGRAMARYAVEHLGYSSLAVLSPVDSHGMDIAEGFIEEVNALGGAYIVVSEWYRTGETNMSQQFYNIRSRGLQDSLHLYISFSGDVKQDDIMKLASQGIGLAVLDSLMERESAVPVIQLLGEDGPRIADSLGITVFTGDLYADSLDVPVRSIEGMFLPITSKDEMGIVSAQIAYHNIRTQLLGSGEWYDLLALEENRRYVNGTYFMSDSYWDTDDSTFIEFFDSFTAATRSRPNRNTLMGYDTMKLVSMLIQEGATSRDALAEALASGIFYRGIHSPIVMGRSRVNTAKNVLRYMGGQIRKVDEIILD